MMPPAVTARVCVEMGRGVRVGEVRRADGGDHRHAVVRGLVPVKDVMKHFGFTTDTVVAAAKKQVGK